MPYSYQSYNPEVLSRLQQTELELLKEFVRICDKYELRYFAMFGTIIGAVRHKGFVPWDDDIDLAMPREDYNRFLEVSKKEWDGEKKYRMVCPEYSGSYYHLTPRILKNGTRFISKANYYRYNVGISIDIFVFDYVSSDLIKRLKQIKKMCFWANVYMVRNVNYLKVDNNTFKKKILHLFLAIIRLIMIVCHISPDWILKKYYKWVNKYPEDKEYMTIPYEYCPNEICSKESELFPVVKMPFEDIEVALPKNYHAMATRIYGDYMTPPPKEKWLNHAPLLVEFEDGLRQVNGTVEQVE